MYTSVPNWGRSPPAAVKSGDEHADTKGLRGLESENTPCLFYIVNIYKYIYIYIYTYIYVYNN
jgi:hypothetical protein